MPRASVQRQAHRTLILDSGSYLNDGANAMYTLSTWDHRLPAEFRAAAKKDFERYGCVEVVKGEAKSVQKISETLFKVTTTVGRTFAAHKILLAAGVEDRYLDIPGYAECWIAGM